MTRRLSEADSANGSQPIGSWDRRTCYGLAGSLVGVAPAPGRGVLTVGTVEPSPFCLPADGALGLFCGATDPQPAMASRAETKSERKAWLLMEGRSVIVTPTPASEPDRRPPEDLVLPFR